MQERCIKTENMFGLNWQVNFIEGKFHILGRDISSEQLATVDHESGSMSFSSLVRKSLNPVFGI
jgi:hypothetical protein